MNTRLKILAGAVGALLLLGGAAAANAQAFKLNQTISPIKTGVVYSNGVSTSTLFATTSPTVGSITATSSTLTSNFAGGLTVSGTTNLAALAGGGTLCLHVSNTGVVGTAVADCGSGGSSFGYPFPLNATTTVLTFTGGLVSSASSSIAILNLGTPLTVANGGTGAGTLTGLVVGNGTSAMTAYAGATCTNQFIRILSASGAATCATVGAADVSLAALTATDSTLTFSGSYTGATARTIGLNLGNANTFTALQRFSANASSTMESIYQKAYFGGTATSTFDSAGVLTLATPLTVASGGTGAGTITGLVVGNGTSAMTAYGGATCTNQFVRVLSAAGAATCATVGAADVSLAALTATDSTLTFSGSYTGATARTIGLNLGQANVWTALQRFTGNASSTMESVFGPAYFGATATSTFDSAGVLTLATPLAVGSGGTGSTTLSSGSLIYGRGTTQVGAVGTSSIAVSAGLTNTGTLGSQVGGTALTLKQLENRSFTASSTAPFATATTTIPLEIGYGEVWNNIQCYTDVGTVVVQFGYGTASTSAFTASTTVGVIAATPNNTMTAGNKVKVDIGTAASSPNKLTCTINDTI